VEKEKGHRASSTIDHESKQDNKHERYFQRYKEQGKKRDKQAKQQNILQSSKICIISLPKSWVNKRHKTYYHRHLRIWVLIPIPTALLRDGRLTRLETEENKATGKLIGHKRKVMQ
jgi:hypothetical protein